jgi:hypothetical protein
VTRLRPDFVIRDPLWGDIYLFDEERRVVDADLFQGHYGVESDGRHRFNAPRHDKTTERSEISD